MLKKSRMFRFIHYWLPVCLLCTGIFVQSSFATPDVLPHWSFLDKILHAGVFGLLSVLICRALNSLPRWHGRTMQIMVGSILMTLLYGASDEWHQSFVIERTADMGDLLADFTGGVLGSFVFLGARLLDRSKPNVSIT